MTSVVIQYQLSVNKMVCSWKLEMILEHTYVFWLVIIHLLYLSLPNFLSSELKMVGYFGGIEGGASWVI